MLSSDKDPPKDPGLMKIVESTSKMAIGQPSETPNKFHPNMVNKLPCLGSKTSYSKCFRQMTALPRDFERKLALEYEK